MGILAFEQCGILRDDSKPPSEIHQTNGTGIESVDANVPFCSLNYAEEAQCQGAFSSSSPPYYTNFLMWFEG
jgi:hypothetical protein